jgi:hypothetical protein
VSVVRQGLARDRADAALVDIADFNQAGAGEQLWREKAARLETGEGDLLPHEPPQVELHDARRAARAAKASAVAARAVPPAEAVKKAAARVTERLRVEPPRNGDAGPRAGDTRVRKRGAAAEEAAQLAAGRWVALCREGERLARVAAAVRVGLYPIVAFAKQLLNLLGNLV